MATKTKTPKTDADSDLDADDELEPEDTGDDDAGDDDTGADDDDEDLSTDEIIAKAVKAATDAANSTADKRINQLITKLDKRDAGQDDSGDGDSSTGGDSRLTKKLVGLSIREAVEDLDLDTDDARTVRKLAAEISSFADYASIEDEDAFAETIVERAAALVEDTRSSYGQQLRDTKERRGGSNGTKKRQPGKGPKVTPEQEALAAYAEGGKRAKEKFGN